MSGRVVPRRTLQPSRWSATTRPAVAATTNSACGRIRPEIVTPTARSSLPRGLPSARRTTKVAHDPVPASTCTVAAFGMRAVGRTTTSPLAAHVVKTNTSPVDGRSAAGVALPSQSQSPRTTRSPGSADLVAPGTHDDRRAVDADRLDAPRRCRGRPGGDDARHQGLRWDVVVVGGRSMDGRGRRRGHVHGSGGRFDVGGWCGAASRGARRPPGRRPQRAHRRGP